LLKDYHCGILMRAEKTNILCGDEEGKVLLLRIVCQETHSDMTWTRKTGRKFSVFLV